jgi:hypothetical protein
VKKQEQEGHTEDPELVALYYKLAHVEALEHEANRYKYNLELHHANIDPRLRKFTMNELQNMNERNLLHKFEEILQNNRKAILEFYEKKKDVRTYDEPVDKVKAGGNIPFQETQETQEEVHTWTNTSIESEDMHAIECMVPNERFYGELHVSFYRRFLD